MTIDIGALGASLSRCLADVRRGATITVTERGDAIARIVPAGAPTTLERRIAEGRVTPGTRPKGPAPRRVSASASVSELLVDR